MSAIVSIKQVYGSTPTSETITNVRFNTDDLVNPGETNPLVKPSKGVYRSYAKTIYLNADTAPNAYIDNVTLYCDGDIDWEYVTVYVGTSDTYVQATGTEGRTGINSDIAIEELAGYTVLSPKSINGSIGIETGRITDYVILQVDLSRDVSAQTLPIELITFKYDEN